MTNRLNHENPPIDPNDTQSKKQYDIKVKENFIIGVKEPMVLKYVI